MTDSKILSDEDAVDIVSVSKLPDGILIQRIPPTVDGKSGRRQSMLLRNELLRPLLNYLREAVKELPNDGE